MEFSKLIKFLFLYYFIFTVLLLGLSSSYIIGNTGSIDFLFTDTLYYLYFWPNFLFILYSYYDKIGNSGSNSLLLGLLMYLILNLSLSIYLLV